MLRKSGDMALRMDFSTTAICGKDRYTIHPGIPAAIRIHASEWYESLVSDTQDAEYVTVIKDTNYSRVESAKGQMQAMENAYGKACASVKQLARKLEERRIQAKITEKNGGEYNEAYIEAAERELEAAEQTRDVALERFNEAAETVEGGSVSFFPITRKAIEDITFYDTESVAQILTVPSLPQRRLAHADL